MNQAEQEPDREPQAEHTQETGAAAPQQDGRQAALQALTGPAIGIQITALMNVVLFLGGIAMTLVDAVAPHRPRFGATHHVHDLGDTVGALFAAVVMLAFLFLSIFLFIGAKKLRRAESYGLALVTAILVMVPPLSPCCMLGLPFGIWALIVLLRPEVKRAFV